MSSEFENISYVDETVIFYDEQIDFLKWSSIALILFASILIRIDPKEKIVLTSGRWYGFVAVCILMLFFRNGGLKIAEELNLDTTLVLVLSYLFGILWFSIQISMNKTKIVYQNKKKRSIFLLRDHFNFFLATFFSILSK